MTELVYTFNTPDDARVYLREVSTLWIVWIIGLAGLMITHALVLIVWAIAALTALVVVSRPLQRRAEELVPENKVEGGKINTALRGGTTRDRALRDLFYGTAPIQAALQTVGLSHRWIVIRNLVVALTLLALVYVVLNPVP